MNEIVPDDRRSEVVIVIPRRDTHVAIVAASCVRTAASGRDHGGRRGAGSEVAGAMSACTFYGSYYDPAPWVDAACAAADSVPAGCPLPFVIDGEVGSNDIAVAVSRGSAAVPNDATLMFDGSDTEPIDGAKDVDSCTCDPEQVSATFDRYEVDVTPLEPGDQVTVLIGNSGGGSRGTLTFAIDAAAACPAIDWPAELDAAIACDDCPIDDGSDGNGGSGAVGDDDPGGCNTSGGAPLWIGLAALVLVRRRRQSSEASSSRLRV